MIKHNPQRGEVPIKVGEHELVLCADLENTAALEAALGNATFDDIQHILHFSSVRAAKAVLSCLTVSGDPQAAVKALTHLDVIEVCSAGLEAFAAQFPEPEDGEKKDESAAESD